MYKRQSHLDPQQVAADRGGDLVTVVGPPARAVLDRVGARLAEGDAEIVGDLRIDARGRHRAEQYAARERHAGRVALEVQSPPDVHGRSLLAAAPHITRYLRVVRR